MIQVIKVRLYPNHEQGNLLTNLFGQYRFVYNKCLEYKENMYSSGVTVSTPELQKYFHSTLVKENEFLQQFNSNILKGSIQVLYTVYQRFFKNISGKPKFKSKHDKQSVEFVVPTCISRMNLENGKLNFTKNLKNFKFETSKKYKEYIVSNKDYVKSITVSKTSTGKYYAAIRFDSPNKVNTKVVEPIHEINGFDLGVKTFLVGSDGSSFQNIHSYKSIEKDIKFLQRKLARQTKGSKNRNKTKQKIAILFERSKNIKMNYLHNISSKIINENQVVVIEDLNVDGMLKNHCLAKAVQEVSMYEFRRQLDYKSVKYDRRLVVVDRYFPSSKTCSRCGHIKDDLTLNDRIYVCTECDLVIDRDENAAINLKHEGKRIIG